MKIKKIKGIVQAALAIGGVALLSGCVGAFNPISNTSSQQTGSTSYPPTAAKNVILATNTPNCKYSNVGVTSVRSVNVLGFNRSSADIESDLQEEAAKIGGNAVIGVKFNLQFYQGSVVYIPNVKACLLQAM